MILLYYISRVLVDLLRCLLSSAVPEYVHNFFFPPFIQFIVLVHLLLWSEYENHCTAFHHLHWFQIMIPMFFFNVKKKKFTWTQGFHESYFCYLITPSWFQSSPMFMPLIPFSSIDSKGFLRKALVDLQVYSLWTNSTGSNLFQRFYNGFFV